MVLQLTLALITRRNFEPPGKIPKLEGFHTSGPGRHPSETPSTLVRHSGDTFFWVLETMSGMWS
eukprot:3550656-Pyramimonas_sp.AAC.1